MSDHYVNETGCEISRSHITGDIVCQSPGPDCDCLIVAGSSVSRFDHPGITITRCGEDTHIRADGAALWAWAHRTGAYWPCSSLAVSDGVDVLLQHGDLIDLTLDNGEDESLTADELNAFIADATGRDARDGH